MGWEQGLKYLQTAVMGDSRNFPQILKSKIHIFVYPIKIQYFRFREHDSFTKDGICFTGDDTCTPIKDIGKHDLYLQAIGIV